MKCGASWEVSASLDAGRRVSDLPHFAWLSVRGTPGEASDLLRRIAFQKYTASEIQSRIAFAKSMSEAPFTANAGTIRG